MSTQFKATHAYIALGSNLGDSRRIIGDAIDALRPLSLQALLVSSFYQTEPIDCPPGSPPFINAAVAFVPEPSETPESLLQKLQALEKKFGRMPKQLHNESRPLDLDLVAFGSEVRSSPELTLPHPRAHLREFVLAPLAEIAPNLVLPGQRQTVGNLLANCPTQGVRRLP